MWHFKYANTIPTFQCISNGLICGYITGIHNKRIILSWVMWNLSHSIRILWLLSSIPSTSCFVIIRTADKSQLMLRMYTCINVTGFEKSQLSCTIINVWSTYVNYLKCYTYLLEMVDGGWWKPQICVYQYRKLPNGIKLVSFFAPHITHEQLNPWPTWPASNMAISSRLSLSRWHRVI